VKIRREVLKKRKGRCYQRNNVTTLTIVHVAIRIGHRSHRKISSIYTRTCSQSLNVDFQVKTLFRLSDD